MLRCLSLFGLLLFCISFSSAQSSKFPKEINLVFDYLLKKDYPEVFGDKSYQFRPVDFEIIDIDGDGTTEVFLQSFPHYTQSPTITIFKIGKNDSVSRLIEGFAPGRLEPISREDDYITPHSTGSAIDATIPTQDPAKMEVFGKASLKQKGSIILYRNFFHTDFRTGSIYIDLRYLEDKTGDTCADFQFGKPIDICAGKISGSSSSFFIARCKDELFCYEIKGFDGLSFVNDVVTIVPAPGDMDKMIVEGGVIKYRNLVGTIFDLKL